MVAQPGGDEILLVQWLRRWVLVAWTPGHQRIRTFLPLDAQFTEEGEVILPGREPEAWEREIEASRRARERAAGPG